MDRRAVSASSLQPALSRPNLGFQEGTAYAFLLCLYFVPGGSFSNIPILIFVMALIWQYMQHRSIPLSRGTRATILFLIAAAAWISVPVALRTANANAHATGIGNFLLLALFAAYVDLLSRRIELERLLVAIVALSTASALASLVWHFGAGHTFAERMWPLGRGGNPIPGAGGLACGLIALWALTPFRRSSPAILASAFAAASLLAAVILTGSRGPILGLVLGIGLAYTLGRIRSPSVLVGAPLLAWGTVSGVVLLETLIKQAICSDAYDLCRPSFRQGIWAWAGEQIALNPIFGTGPGFRFPDKLFNHPHNGLIGTAMFYGLPLAAVALGAFLLVVPRVARLKQPGRRWALASLIFSAAYMGTDLSNPFAFYNTHYLFLWMPLFYVVARAGGELEQSEQDPQAMPGTA